ncbi:MAG: hypothetical protein R2864_14200 [Syntrophotaleaceae bacterium]
MVRAKEPALLPAKRLQAGENRPEYELLKTVPFGTEVVHFV